MADLTVQEYSGNNFSAIMGQPTSVNQNALGETGNNKITVRNMQNTEEECEFVSRLTVEGLKDKYIHATSEDSLEMLITAFSLDNQNQNQDFYQQRFIAEINGEKAGLLVLECHGEPKPIVFDEHYDSLGFRHRFGLSCLAKILNEEEVPPGKSYVDLLSVKEKYRGRGIGKVLLDTAEYEAKKRGFNTIYLYVHTKNRAKHLYLRQGYEVKSKTCCCCLMWYRLGIMRAALMEKQI